MESLVTSLLIRETFMGADLELVVDGRPIRFPAAWLRPGAPRQLGCGHLPDPPGVGGLGGLERFAREHHGQPGLSHPGVTEHEDLGIRVGACDPATNRSH